MEKLVEKTKYLQIKTLLSDLAVFISAHFSSDWKVNFLLLLHFGPRWVFYWIGCKENSITASNATVWYFLVHFRSFGYFFIFMVFFGSVLAFHRIDCNENPIIASIAEVLLQTPLNYQTGSSIYILRHNHHYSLRQNHILHNHLDIYPNTDRIFDICKCRHHYHPHQNNFYQNHLQLRKEKNPPNWRPPGIRLIDIPGQGWPALPLRSTWRTLPETCNPGWERILVNFWHFHL